MPEQWELRIPQRLSTTFSASPVEKKSLKRSLSGASRSQAGIWELYLLRQEANKCYGNRSSSSFAGHTPGQLTLGWVRPSSLLLERGPGRAHRRDIGPAAAVDRRGLASSGDPKSSERHQRKFYFYSSNYIPASLARPACPKANRIDPISLPPPTQPDPHTHTHSLSPQFGPKSKAPRAARRRDGPLLIRRVTQGQGGAKSGWPLSLHRVLYVRTMDGDRGRGELLDEDDAAVNSAGSDLTAG